MVATADKLAIKQAQKLWDQLKQCLINAGRITEEIITTEAWKPLGYGSFAESWMGQGMNEIEIASDMRPQVVYQLYAEGHSEEFVADNVLGVGPAKAKAYRRERANGVPANRARGKSEAATTDDDKVVVTEHGRGKPSKPETLHITVGYLMRRELERMAKQHGCSVQEFVIGLIDSGLRGLKRAA
jgi:hypothetical protein